jgi:hypothetical protein
MSELPELPKGFDTTLIRSKVRDASPAQDGSSKRATRTKIDGSRRLGKGIQHGEIFIAPEEAFYGQSATHIR